VTVPDKTKEARPGPTPAFPAQQQVKGPGLGEHSSR